MSWGEQYDKRVSLATRVEEFANPCHGENDGRFCETPGGGSGTAKSTVVNLPAGYEMTPKGPRKIGETPAVTISQGDQSAAQAAEATKISQPESSTPAGWHPDPTGRHTHRYWDGSKWTEAVGDNGVQGVDADLSPAPAPAAPTYPGHPNMIKGVTFIPLELSKDAVDVESKLKAGGFFGGKVKPSHAKNLASAVQVLDTVISLPSHTDKATVLTTGDEPKGTFGHYNIGGENEIFISSKTRGDGADEKVAETIIHEFAHHLANNKGFRKAVDISGIVGALNASQAKANWDAGANQGSGFFGGKKQEKGYYAYLGSEQEMFARAFSQYIGQKISRAQGDNSNYLTQIHTSTEFQHQHWAADDFEPIFQQFDAAFRKAGMLTFETPKRVGT